MLSAILSATDLSGDDKSKFEAIYHRYKNALFFKALEIVNGEHRGQSPTFAIGAV